MFWAYLLTISTELAVTSKRILVKIGPLKGELFEAELSKLLRLEAVQGRWGRFFDFGTVTVRARNGKSIRIRNIANPIKFKFSVEEFSGRYAT